MVFVSHKDGFGEDLCGCVNVGDWCGVGERVFDVLCEKLPIGFFVVCVGASVLSESEVGFCVEGDENGEMIRGKCC